jgi:hypothetical protein
LVAAFLRPFRQACHERRCSDTDQPWKLSITRSFENAFGTALLDASFVRPKVHEAVRLDQATSRNKRLRLGIALGSFGKETWSAKMKVCVPLLAATAALCLTGPVKSGCCEVQSIGDKFPRNHWK